MPASIARSTGRFLGQSFEAFRAAVAGRARVSPPSDTDAGGADLGFSWPAEAFAEARPFVMELHLAASEDMSA